jgi:hypothetical protein
LSFTYHKRTPKPLLAQAMQCSVDLRLLLRTIMREVRCAMISQLKHAFHRLALNIHNIDLKGCCVFLHAEQQLSRWAATWVLSTTRFATHNLKFEGIAQD